MRHVLVSFNAYPHADEVNVIWSTATEINSDYFTIERSADGITYENIISLPGAGNSSNMLYYSATDHYPLSGLSFYRLKETDVDGSLTYSLPVSVRFDNASNEFELAATHILNGSCNLAI